MDGGFGDSEKQKEIEGAHGCSDRDRFVERGGASARVHGGGRDDRSGGTTSSNPNYPNIAIGNGATVMNEGYLQNDNGPRTPWLYGVAIGYNANSLGNGAMAIGSAATASAQSAIAFGVAATAHCDGRVVTV